MAWLYLLTFAAGTLFGYALSSGRLQRRADRAAIQRRLIEWAG